MEEGDISDWGGNISDWDELCSAARGDNCYLGTRPHHCQTKQTRIAAHLHAKTCSKCQEHAPIHRSRRPCLC